MIMAQSITELLSFAGATPVYVQAKMRQVCAHVDGVDYYVPFSKMTPSDFQMLSDIQQTSTEGNPDELDDLWSVDPSTPEPSGVWDPPFDLTSEVAFLLRKMFPHARMYVGNDWTDWGWDNTGVGLKIRLAGTTLTVKANNLSQAPRDEGEDMLAVSQEYDLSTITDADALNVLLVEPLRQVDQRFKAAVQERRIRSALSITETEDGYAIVGSEEMLVALSDLLRQCVSMGDGQQEYLGFRRITIRMDGRKPS
jgi:hypothetical protein